MILCGRAAGKHNKQNQIEAASRFLALNILETEAGSTWKPARVRRIARAAEIPQELSHLAKAMARG